jgi:hypothetical protein
MTEFISAPPLNRIGNTVLYDVESLSHTGIYSTVWKARAPGEIPKDSIDVIIKKHAADPADIDVQIKDWQDYRKIVALYESVTGISVPRSLDYEVREDGVYFVDESAGDADVSKILDDLSVSREAKDALVAGLFNSLASIPRDENHQLAFMIDGKFSNFCPKEDGTFSYIDLFPAHTHKHATHLLKPGSDHLNGKRSIYTDSFVTGDMYGVLGRFMGTLRKDHSELWSTLGKNPDMQVAFQNLPPDLRQYCSLLLEDDTMFIRSLYTFGAENPTSPQFDNILNHNLK